ncbi:MULTISPECIES: oligopeptide ABC transporter permease OppC [Terrabacteria group]|uniref:oligopeptide ABC transporter permease OppC n=1 Tax=Bacillati TaxID=1783272 RepID=UPI0019397F92|nr:MULTISPECIES: oligopeptide ABC transporter permease OppC [Terrabacteria group]MBW9212126.1 ABC transporter permease [Trueperella sp. zg.1013]QRG86328.1 ABC transporter permease [Bulleidia sp. zg-1006]
MNDELFTFVDIDSEASEHIASPHYSYWKSVSRKFFSSKTAIFFLVLSLIVILMAIIYPSISGFNPALKPHVNDFSRRFIKPNATFWFGTDTVGDSLFDSVWLGTRTSLNLAIIATIITNVVGVVVGAFWGYSKKLDVFMLELYNVIANVPFTLVVMVLMYVIGQGFWQLIFALTVTSWLGTAYSIRIQVMMIRDREYNLASRCLGTSTPKIIRHNILPYLVSVIVTQVSRDVPNYISYEVFLSFLGIGLSANDVSLGQLISKYSTFMTSAAYLFWIPVFMSAIISVSLYIVGQTLADASDPRTHM